MSFCHGHFLFWSFRAFFPDPVLVSYHFFHQKATSNCFYCTFLPLSFNFFKFIRFAQNTNRKILTIKQKKAPGVSAYRKHLFFFGGNSPCVLLTLNMKVSGSRRLVQSKSSSTSSVASCRISRISSSMSM